MVALLSNTYLNYQHIDIKLANARYLHLHNKQLYKIQAQIDIKLNLVCIHKYYIKNCMFFYKNYDLTFKISMATFFLYNHCISLNPLF
ncbi:unnamed protein product [Chrysodeixis includens]|uniref:Uncharacterized protein n=1 Tax=Chrysodeixis includens TaxID=689277 RepID=A0A9N8KYQ9_CHRIL|nr:unnamed protein product [Chrysodeixis includens]